MIRYDLRCDKGHDFDSWFRSGDGFDAMRASGQVTCPRCASAKITKRLMAPAVSAATPAAKRGTKALTTPAPGPSQALAALRARIEAGSDYVGQGFADQARAMHEGREPHRPIYGEARPDEARALVDDGVPIAPLPFIPRQKTN